MRIAITGDLHIDPTNIKDSEMDMKELIRVLDDKAVDILMIAGDIFCNFNICGRDESFGTVFNTVLSPLKDFLSQDEKRRILMIPGNHDMSTRKDQKDALYGFEYQDRIIVSHTIESFYMTRGLLVVTLPWMYPGMYKSKKVLLDKLEALGQAANKPVLKLLLGHCEIEGCKMPSGYTALGGHFKFTREELNSLGFDEILLGHIHMRQLYYLGPPWQHDFGEEGITGVIEILELTEGLFERKIVEVPNTPKYYTIKSEDVDNIRVRPIDHVKVRGKVCPTLPSKNFIFEKEIDEKEFRTRSDVSIDDDVEVLLSKWLRYSKKYDVMCIKELIKTLLSLDIPQDYMYRGSLEKILFIELINIGLHKNTVLTFSNKDSIIAIAGANGSGKTIFIESVIAALYGEFPSYGHIDELIPQGEVGKINIGFTSNGKKYCLMRQIGSSHTAVLYNEKEELIVGPKVTEVKKYIESLVGPKELLLSSIFSSQSFEGDITEIPPVDRKQVFSKLLGLMHLDEIYCKIDEKLQGIEAQIDINQNLIDDVNLDEMSGRIEISRNTLKQCEVHLEIIENGLVGLKQGKIGYAKANLKLLEDIGKCKENQGINKKWLEHKVLSDNLSEVKKRITEEDFSLKGIGVNRNLAEKNLDVKIKDLEGKGKLLEQAGCKDNLLKCSFIDDAVVAPEKIEKLEKLKDETLGRVDEDVSKQKKVLDELVMDRGVLIKEVESKAVEIQKLTSKSGEFGKLQEELSKSTKDLEDLVELISSKESKRSEFQIEIVKEKKELIFCQRALRNLETLITTQDALEKDFTKYNILRSAFSKDGIPQLIIDAALPQLQEILNILSAYIKRFSIEVTTQQELKSGGAKETIGFLVDDGVKKRDIKYFSGGERKLLKGFIRIGMSLFQSQRTGGRYSVLFLDEAFDSLDPSRAMLLMRIIDNLSEIFNQIFVVSHTNDLLGQFGKVIIFENRNDRVEVVNGEG